jgi:hypothetical protein
VGYTARVRGGKVVCSCSGTKSAWLHSCEVTRILAARSRVLKVETVYSDGLVYLKTL